MKILREDNDRSYSLNSDNFNNMIICGDNIEALAFESCSYDGSVSSVGGKKPEKLLQLILKHFSNLGDLILDFFGGSGTTAVTAHKMNRKLITIEINDQAHTHIYPRLKSIVDETDPTNITKDVLWNSDSGFKFYNIEEKHNQ